MAYRPTWQGHLKLSLVTCPVALYTATNSAGDVHFNLINPKTNNRIKMITTDPDTGPDRALGPGQGLRGLQGRVHPADRRGDQVGQAGEHQDHRHRAVRSRRRDRPHLLGQPLLPGAGRQAGPGGLRRHPDGHGEVRPDRARAASSCRRASASWRWSRAARASSPTPSARTPRSGSPTRSSAASRTPSRTRR